MKSPFRHMFAVAVLIIFPLLLLNSCEFDSWNQERQLSIEDPETNVQTVYQTESLYPFVDTKQFFIFSEQKVVLTLYFDNTSRPFPIDAEFHVFDEDEPLAGIQDWVNNQHSDVIYINPAEPIREESLPLENIQIISETIVDHIMGQSGDEYDHYIVEYYINAYRIFRLLSLEGFKYEVPVFHRVHDIEG